MEIKDKNRNIEVKEIAAAVRAIRKQKGLTLKEVEEISGGKWKSVVIGSYERCDRALSLKKAMALAEFYQVPLDQLLGLGEVKARSENRVILDLRKIGENPERSRLYLGLENFLKEICKKRHDWNGEVLSIRKEDLFTLSILQGVEESFVFPWLKERGYLFN